LIRATRAWWAAGLLAALGRAEPATGADLSERVEYAGCREVWLEDEPRCVLGTSGNVELWVEHVDPAEIQVQVDDEPWAREEFHADGIDGFGLRVELPVEARTLEVIERSTMQTWVLPVISAERAIVGPDVGVRTSMDVDRQLGAAFVAALRGHHAEALEILAGVEADAQRYPKGRADHAAYLGTVLWWQGRFHDAATSLRDGVVFATKFQDRELQRDALPMYAVVLVELGYLEAASEWSDLVLGLAREDPRLFACEQEGKLLSTLGWVDLSWALQRGEAPRHARALLEEAIALVGPGGRCPDAGSVPGVSLSLALVELLEDDPSGALAELADVGFEDATVDQRLRLHDAETAALMDLGRPRPVVEASLARLAEAVARAPTPEGRWRLALRRGDLFMRQLQLAQAVAAYREAEQHALQLTELAAVGVGRETAATLHAQSTESLVKALVLWGRPEEAFCAAREAQARRIQGVGGAEHDPARRAELAAANTAYATAKQALDGALMLGERSPRKQRERLRLEVAHAERELADAANRILSGRSTWRPACRDLAPRGEGELLLGLYAMRWGWLVFAQDDEGTTARWIAGGPSRGIEDPALGAELLEPLGERIEAAHVVKVVAGGQAQLVDVHLLEWRGRLLVERKPVMYGAELPHRPRGQQRAGARPRALVVADPTETLQMAGAERLVVGIGLLLEGWEVDAPMPEEADLERIRDGLAGSSFFYYAGHAEHDVGTRGGSWPPYAGGTASVPAQMRLRPPAVLGMQDVVFLDAVPRHVALIGCQTGVPDQLGGGMSLALAFLVAGAEAVVATPVETDDAVGAGTGMRLLKGVTEGGVDLVEGLRWAQAEMVREGLAVGRYRVWVR
jgi:hypothetical protein